MASKKLITLLLAFFIITIMVASVLNSRSINSENTIKYKGYKFIKSDQGWLTYINDQPIILNNNPKDLENIQINFNLNDLNSNEKIYLSLNPNDNLNLAIAKFSTYIELSPRIVPSCYEDNEQCSNSPIKTCKDASSNIGVIIFKKSTSTNIEFKDNCLAFEGNNIELLKYIDKLILIQLGI